LKLWFVLRRFGASGLRDHVTRHVEAARWFAEHVDADDRFERVAPTDLSLVCFVHRDGDDASAALLDAVNATGNAFLTHTRLRERYVIRVAVGGTYTEQRHVESLWELIDALA
jgi:aromatic-L-amino-acid decarboxylase